MSLGNFTRTIAINPVLLANGWSEPEHDGDHHHRELHEGWHARPLIYGERLDLQLSLSADEDFTYANLEIATRFHTAGIAGGLVASA